jgi:hypothetical protein
MMVLLAVLMAVVVVVVVVKMGQMLEDLVLLAV